MIIPLTELPEGKEVQQQLGEANRGKAYLNMECRRSEECEGEAWKTKDMMMLGESKWERKTGALLKPAPFKF